MSALAASNPFVRILPYILREWRQLCMILLMTVCVAGASALMPWPLKIIVDFSIGGLPLPDSVRSMLESVGLTSTPEFLVIAAALLSLLLFLISASSPGEHCSRAAAFPRTDSRASSHPPPQM